MDKVRILSIGIGFVKKAHNEDYYFLESDLNYTSPELDDTSVENLYALQEDGWGFIEKNKEVLGEVVGKLVDNE